MYIILLNNTQTVEEYHIQASWYVMYFWFCHDMIPASHEGIFMNAVLAWNPVSIYMKQGKEDLGGWVVTMHAL